MNLISRAYFIKLSRATLLAALFIFLFVAVLNAAAQNQPFPATNVAAQNQVVVATNAAAPSPVLPAPNALSIPGTLPDTGASILRVLGALVLVISLFLGGVWLFRNWQRLAFRKGRAPRLNVLEVRSLGQRQAIYVVGYQQQRILLASSPAGITLLSHLPEEEEAKTAVTGATASTAPATRMSFAEAFQHVLNRRQ